MLGVPPNRALLRILLNGTAVIGQSGGIYWISNAASAISGTFDVTTLYALSAGDYLQLSYYAVTDYTRGILYAANYSPVFWATWQRGL